MTRKLVYERYRLYYHVIHSLANIDFKDKIMLESFVRNCH